MKAWAAWQAPNAPQALHSADESRTLIVDRIQHSLHAVVHESGASLLLSRSYAPAGPRLSPQTHREIQGVP